VICVVDILQEFNTLFLTRFGTYKIATPPQTKIPVKTTFRDWSLYSSFVHGLYFFHSMMVKHRNEIIKHTRSVGTKIYFVLN
jgi:hypothetical protein